ncbi:adenosine-specific kinase, partial [Mycobacterium tuberculosis]|uniref:adenosine-specific kinase n=1 Tax=Mycobacterium tuberculosis TaxID=1773 RepID=UPI001F18DF37
LRSTPETSRRLRSQIRESPDSPGRFTEVCTIYCATANPVDVVVAVTPHGRGIVGVVDGQTPLGVETDRDIAQRRDLLRAIGYKL